MYVLITIHIRNRTGLAMPALDWTVFHISFRLDDDRSWTTLGVHATIWITLIMQNIPLQRLPWLAPPHHNPLEHVLQGSLGQNVVPYCMLKWGLELPSWWHAQDSCTGSWVVGSKTSKHLLDFRLLPLIFLPTFGLQMQSQLLHHCRVIWHIITCNMASLQVSINAQS